MVSSKNRVLKGWRLEIRYSVCITRIRNNCEIKEIKPQCPEINFFSAEAVEYTFPSNMKKIKE